MKPPQEIIVLDGANDYGHGHQRKRGGIPNLTVDELKAKRSRPEVIEIQDDDPVTPKEQKVLLLKCFQDLTHVISLSLSLSLPAPRPRRGPGQLRRRDPDRGSAQTTEPANDPTTRNPTPRGRTPPPTEAGDARLRVSARPQTHLGHHQFFLQRPSHRSC